MLYEVITIWPGMCAIHHRMKTEHVEAARKRHPGALVVVSYNFV